jgi:hypothetical protein
VVASFALLNPPRKNHAACFALGTVREFFFDHPSSFALDGLPFLRDWVESGFSFQWAASLKRGVTV